MRDPQVFEEPELFRPERFLVIEPKNETENENFKFEPDPRVVPFGKQNAFLSKIIIKNVLYILSQYLMEITYFKLYHL